MSRASLERIAACFVALLLAGVFLVVLRGDTSSPEGEPATRPDRRDPGKSPAESSPPESSPPEPSLPIADPVASVEARGVLLAGQLSRIAATNEPARAAVQAGGLYQKLVREKVDTGLRAALVEKAASLAAPQAVAVLGAFAREEEDPNLLRRMGQHLSKLADGKAEPEREGKSSAKAAAPGSAASDEDRRKILAIYLSPWDVPGIERVGRILASREEREAVRLAALAHLARSGRKETLPWLAGPLLAGESGLVATNALASLARSADPEAGSVLLAVWKRRPDAALRKTLLDLVGRLGSSHAHLAVVEQALSDPEPVLQAAARRSREELLKRGGRSG